MKHCLLAILGAMLLMLGSCRSSKPAVVPTVPADIEASEASPKQLYQALAQSYADWTDVYTSVNLSLNAPASLSASGRCTMVRDKQIHISLRMLGFEVAVLYIDQDSVRAVEKIHKYYLAESIDDLLRGANLTIGDLQALLMGQVFAPGDGVITANDRDFELAVDGDDLILRPKRTPRNTQMLYTCSVSVPPILQCLDIDVPDRASVDCSYSDYQTTPGGQVARQIDITADASRRKIAASLRWDLKSAKWDTGRQINFTPPKGYKRIKASSLLKSLSSL